MRSIRYFGILISIIAVGCTTTAPAGGEAEPTSLSDVVSITQLPNGTYQVVCKDGRQEVDTQQQILANQVCVASCVATSCAAQGKDCGTIGDGCNGTLSCGTCSGNQSCGGGGTANVCGGPGDPSDPYDPASCSGAAMTASEAQPHFGIGAVDATLASYQVVQRVRTCNQLTGCLPWGDDHEDLQYANGSLHLVLGANSAISAQVDDAQGNELCSAVGDTQSCSSGKLPGAHDYGGVLTNHCFRVAASYTTMPDAMSNYTIHQKVLLTSFTGGAGCVPVTCQSQGKNCGSINDGCGGTLSCGSCSGLQTCGGGPSGTANVCGGDDPSDPFSATSCVGVPITQTEAVSHFAVGGTDASLGSYHVQQRVRSCNPVSGCTLWAQDNEDPTYNDGTLHLIIGANQSITTQIDDAQGNESCGAIGSPQSCASGKLPGAHDYSGQLTNHCFRVTSGYQSAADAHGVYTDHQKALLVGF